MAWTDESRARAIALYQESDPTPENSNDLLKDIATEVGESPNGVRMILSKAGVWLKKDPATTTAAASEKKATGGTRVSKEASQQALKDAIEKAGGKVDDEIIDKMTGKAAVYFTSLFATEE